MPNQIVSLSAGFLKCTIYNQPINVAFYTKGDAGDATKTLALCKYAAKGNTFCFINIYTIPYAATTNFYAGFAIINASNATTTRDNSSYITGTFSNLREVTYQNESYLAIDVKVRQYGGCYVYISGLHSDITEIKDITGDFSEVN